MEDEMQIGKNFLTMQEASARVEVDGYIDVYTRGRVEVFIFDKSGNVIFKLLRKPADLAGPEGWHLAVTEGADLRIEGE